MSDSAWGKIMFTYTNTETTLTIPYSSVVRALDLKTRGCGFDSQAGQSNNY